MDTPALTAHDVAEKLAKIPGIILEICGDWLWVSGDTKPHRSLFKDLKMLWHRNKQKWYWRPPGKSRYSKRKSDTPMMKIRLTYGSELLTDDD